MRVTIIIHNHVSIKKACIVSNKTFKIINLVSKSHQKLMKLYTILNISKNRFIVLLI